MKCLFHRYHVVLDTVEHKYEVCRRCGKRRIRETWHGCYQPIDEGWLMSGKFFGPNDQERAR